MKAKTKCFIFCFLFLVASCEKDNTKSLDEFILKSTDYKGFLFENLKIISFPNANNQKPDFLVAPHTIENGDVVSPFLVQPDLENRFFLVGEFGSFNSALEHYESFQLPENFHLLQFAFGVKPNQIWLIKTNAEKYGLVLIISTEYNNNNNTPYAEVTFRAKMNSNCN